MFNIPNGVNYFFESIVKHGEVKGVLDDRNVYYAYGLEKQKNNYMFAIWAKTDKEMNIGTYTPVYKVISDEITNENNYEFWVKQIADLQHFKNKFDLANKE